MWSLSQLISLVSDDIPEVNPERVREYLARSYMNLVSQDSNIMRFLTPILDEPHPELTLVTGQSLYSLNEDTLNYTDAVAGWLNINGVAVRVRKAAMVYSKTAQDKTVKFCFNGEDRYKIPCHIFPATRNGDAKITLLGEYRDVYVDFFWVPPVPETAQEELLIDTSVWSDALIDGAIGYYEQSAYGKSERLMMFQRVWIPKFKAYGNDSRETFYNSKFSTQL